MMAAGLAEVTPLSLTPSGPTCKGATELLKISQDLLAQEVDEASDNLQGRG